MLPEVTIQNVSRADVDRLAWWLEDEQLSSKWFGHYGCGDPVHRGYDPRHMLEASEAEWMRVFDDPRRHIYSIYSEKSEHIGECQVVLDGEGGAELSLLIGRQDLWHHGYGTATAMLLLDKVFGPLGVDRAWVNVPEDNTPALGLFQKLGFTREGNRELCKRPDGTALNAYILAMDATFYEARSHGPVPVVTISGLPGSGSEAIGAEVARMIGSRLVDEEMSETLSARLGISTSELEAFENTHRSFWARLLSSIVVPMEWSTGYDVGYHWFRPDPSLDYDLLDDHLTKKKYLEGLARVVRGLAAEKNVVLHLHGSHLLVPPNVGALNVFVSASPELRRRRIATSEGVTLDAAVEWQKSLDKDALSVFKNLFGADLLDMGLYDITLNVDRVAIETAAQIIVGALRIAAPSIEPRVAADLAPSVSAL